MAHRTVRRKTSVERLTEYGRFELEKRLLVGAVIGWMLHWLLFG
jgi:hypothetical protein